MSSVWAFLGGASNELLNQRKQAQEDERVRAEYDRRMTAQQEFQKAAEEAARKNRILASGLDRKSGELYEVTAGGEERRTKAPQAMLEEAQAAEMAAAAKAAREERKFETDVMSKEAQAEAARAQAGASLASAARGNARLAGQIDLDKARAERARRADPLAEGEDKEISGMERDIKAADPKAAARAIAIKRNPNLSREQKLAALNQLLSLAVIQEETID